MVFFIPAESHEQLGLIERHNAMWRHAFEKVVDQLAAVTDDEIDVAIVQTSRGKNQTVRQYGRSIY